MKIPFATIAAFALVSAVTSCRRPHQTVVVDRPDEPAPSTVVIDRDHHHGTECGHYYHNGKWYHDAAHLHVID